MNNTKNKKFFSSGEAQKAVVLLIGNTIVGVGIPYGITKYDPTTFSAFEGVLLGIMIVIMLSIAEIIFSIADMKALRISEYELWTHRSQVDNVINEIRSDLHKMMVDDDLRDSFFIDHYTRELELLESRIQTTISKKQMLLDRFHIDSTEVLFSIYDKRENTEFLATHVLSDITDSFDVTYQFYFRAWLDRLSSKKVKSLKRLFIYDDKDEFLRQNVRKLLAFHNNKIQGLSAKAIPKSEVLRVKSDYQIDDGVLDFGIFSNSYIYLGSSRKDDKISGFFSRDSRAISKYRNCFNAIWMSSHAKPLTDYVSETVTPEQLFDAEYFLK